MNTVSMVMIVANNDENSEWLVDGVLAVCHDEQVAEGVTEEIKVELRRLRDIAEESNQRMLLKDSAWGCAFFEVIVDFDAKSCGERAEWTPPLDHVGPVKGHISIDDDRQTKLESMLCGLQGSIGSYRVFIDDVNFSSITLSICTVPVVGVPS